MGIIETLILRWRAQNVGLAPGNSIAEINDAFARLGHMPTADVIELYSKIGGMNEMENNACWRLWPLAEVVERNVEASPYGVLFSDHLMDSWCYRIRRESDGFSSVFIDYCDSKKIPERLFAGIEKFLLAYAENPNAILAPHHSTS